MARRVSRRHITVDRLRYRNRCVLVGTGFLGDVTMNYYDSNGFKIFKEFKYELDKILIEEIFLSNAIARQMARGALYYKYTKRVLTCLADEDSAKKAAQDVVDEFTRFAVALGERATEISD